MHAVKTSERCSIKEKPIPTLKQFQVYPKCVIAAFAGYLRIVRGMINDKLYAYTYLGVVLHLKNEKR